jgi:hypothetical protein
MRGGISPLSNSKPAVRLNFAAGNRRTRQTPPMQGLLLALSLPFV